MVSDEGRPDGGSVCCVVIVRWLSIHVFVCVGVCVWGTRKCREGKWRRPFHFAAVGGSLYSNAFRVAVLVEA